MVSLWCGAGLLTGVLWCDGLWCDGLWCDGLWCDGLLCCDGCDLVYRDGCAVVRGWGQHCDWCCDNAR